MTGITRYSFNTRMGIRNAWFQNRWISAQDSFWKKQFPGIPAGTIKYWYPWETIRGRRILLCSARIALKEFPDLDLPQLVEMTGISHGTFKEAVMLVSPYAPEHEIVPPNIPQRVIPVEVVPADSGRSERAASTTEEEALGRAFQALAALRNTLDEVSQQLGVAKPVVLETENGWCEQPLEENVYPLTPEEEEGGP